VTRTVFPGLWRHRDFRQLWAAETVSQLGSQVTQLALPIIAVSFLAATPLEMGVLTALETLAFLVVGLPAGAWVDRWRRKRVLVAGDLVRAAALASVPLAWATGGLQLWQLFVVAAVTGTATVFFDVAYQSYLPSLVDLDQVVDGNGKLAASQSVAQVAGPGITGVLLKLISAPVLVVADAVSFLLSAAFIGRIRTPDVVPDRAARRPLRSEIAEGLSFVVRHPLLRRIVACTGTSNLFSAITTALLVLYALRTLHLSQSSLGLVLSAGAVGGLLGAVTAAPFARLVGEGSAIPLSVLLLLPFSACAPLAVLGSPAVLLAASTFGFSWGSVVYNVTQVSFRQRLCPPALLGRMNASVRFLVFGTMPLGGLLGGVLGGWLGIVPALWVGVAGQVVAALPVTLSPLLGMRDLPAGDEAGHHEAGHDEPPVPQPAGGAGRPGPVVPGEPG
jgi:MFS family permease